MTSWGGGDYLLFQCIITITGICVYTINCDCTGMASTQLELCYVLPINTAGKITLDLVIIFNKIAIKGTPQMAADKEAIS